MGWWPFGSSGSQPSDSSNEIDKAVPPPPAGALLPPPPRPAGVRMEPSVAVPFTSFSPPPMSSSLHSSEPAAPPVKNGFVLPWSKTKRKDESLPLPSESTAWSTAVPSSSSLSWADQVFTNPRARNCWESVRMGLKLGLSVGAIFGGLTGTYAAIVHRSPLLVPVSVIGGGISFGFFLGCGMLVRCDSHYIPENQQLQKLPEDSK